MKIEFEYCKEPMPMDTNAVRFLSKRGERHFVLLEETSTEYDRERFREYEVSKKVVMVIEIHPNVTILGHDFFRVNERRKLLGFCPIEFPEGFHVFI